MCGIAGFVTRVTKPASDVLALTQMSRHRGPDDEGYVLVGPNWESVRALGGDETPSSLFDTVREREGLARFHGHRTDAVAAALGHRRLSITDPSVAAHQPMGMEDRACWVSFNGAIYNHRDLRGDLETHGHRFRSGSDTEVVLAAYTQWGLDCLARFNGMWAFAILDVRARCVVLARDRYGVKPLYYWTDGTGAVYFASEIKQFTALPGWRAVANGPRAVDQLVDGQLDHSDETLFRGVHQVPAGHTMLLTGRAPAEPAGRLPARAWYRLPEEPFTGTYRDAVDQYQATFRDAVTIRARSEVPMGAGLSGGLDSSAIVCEAAQAIRANWPDACFRAFTAYAPRHGTDERPWAAVTAAHAAVASIDVKVDVDGLLSELDTLVWHLDEPVGYTSTYAEWCVMRSMRDAGVRVALEGHAADEILGGYLSFHHAHIASLLAGGHLTAAAASAGRLVRGGESLRATVCSIAKHVVPARVARAIRPLVGSRPAAGRWLGAGLGGGAVLAGGSTERTEGFKALARSQLCRTSLPWQLHSADRMSMAHAVETRLPFLDHRLVELVLSCPAHYLLDQGVTKRLHRDALRDSIPAPIADRSDKVGFATPEAEWIQQERPGRFLALANGAVQDSRGVLNEETVRLAGEMIGGRRPYDPILWRWILFGAWARVFRVAV